MEAECNVCTAPKPHLQKEKTYIKLVLCAVNFGQSVGQPTYEAAKRGKGARS